MQAAQAVMMTLAFFAPMAMMVLLDVATFRTPRYESRLAIAPAAPTSRKAAATEAANEAGLRLAA